MRAGRAGTTGLRAWSLRKEDSLYPSLDDVRKACSKADPRAIKPVTAGGLRLRKAFVHCNWERRCLEGGFRPKFNKWIPNNHKQGSCVEKLDAAEQSTI